MNSVVLSWVLSLQLVCNRSGVPVLLDAAAAAPAAVLGGVPAINDAAATIPDAALSAAAVAAIAAAPLKAILWGRIIVAYNKTKKRSTKDIFIKHLI